MLISVSSEFRLIIWPTMAVVSIGEVGSCVFNSASSNVMNVLFIELPLVLELEVLELVDDVEVLVEAALAVVAGVVVFNKLTFIKSPA